MQSWKLGGYRERWVAIIQHNIREDVTEATWVWIQNVSLAEKIVRLLPKVLVCIPGVCRCHVIAAHVHHFPIGLLHFYLFIPEHFPLSCWLSQPMFPCPALHLKREREPRAQRSAHCEVQVTTARETWPREERSSVGSLAASSPLRYSLSPPT
jgi:hypothetical protein